MCTDVEGKHSGLLIILLTWLFLLLTVTCSFAQEDSVKNTSIVYFSPGLRSLRVEITTAIMAYGYGAILDYDLVKLRPEKGELNFGIRGGVERYGELEYGGPTEGNPFTDYYMMLRMTAAGSRTNLSLTGGYSYHTTSSPKYYKSKYNFRVGVEFKIILVEDVFAIILKTNTSFKDRTTSGGIGIAMGFVR